MFRLLREKNRFRETVFLGILTFFCFSFSIFRYLYTNKTLFLFLNWNLFLAIIPYVLTSLTIIIPALLRRKITVFILSAFWLLFFPNSPYILTDLFHVHLDSSMPVWFDLILILSFAWTGLLFGLLSLCDIEQILIISIKRIYVILIVVSLLFLGSFGIYLGRFLRWNSWDILIEPFELIYDVGDRIMHPFENAGTWGMTIFMGIFLNMIYWSFKLIRTRNYPGIS